MGPPMSTRVRHSCALAAIIAAAMTAVAWWMFPVAVLMVLVFATYDLKH